MAGNVPNELHNQAGLTQLWAQKGHRNYREPEISSVGAVHQGDRPMYGSGIGHPKFLRKG